MARVMPYALAWCAGLVAFAVMMAFASAHDTFPGDVWLTQNVQEVDSPLLDEVMRWGSRMIEWPYWGAPALVGSAYALWRAGPRIAPVIVLGLAARFLNNPLKGMVDRPRPSPDDVEVVRLLSTFSFPSGHAYSAVILYGLIFFLATLYVRGARMRAALQAACVIAILWTGLDRVYHGYHWPSDVIGGYVSGLLVLGPLVALGLWLTGRLRLRAEAPGAAGGGDL